MKKDRWVHYKLPQFPTNETMLCGKMTPKDMFIGKRFEAEQVVRNVDDVTCPRCLHKIIDLMKLGLQDVDGLMSESEGVAGLHLNGDIAHWSELENDSWLYDFTIARNL